MGHTDAYRGTEASRAALLQMQMMAGMEVPPVPPAIHIAQTEDPVVEAQLFSAMGGDPNDKEAMAKFTRQARAAYAGLAEPPTPYEDTAMWNMLSGMYGELEQAAIKADMRPKRQPLIGTIPSGNVQAMAVPVRADDSRIILFEHGLFPFANLMSKALIGTAQIVEHDSTKNQGRLQLPDAAELEKIDTNHEAFLRFRECLLAYVCLGNPYRARQYFLPGGLTNAAGMLRDAMEYFVLGHEMGHLIGGHLEADRVRDDAWFESVVKDDPEAAKHGDLLLSMFTSYQDEHEADRIGLRFSTAVMQKRKLDLSLSVWGGDLFFACLEAVDAVKSLLLYGERRETLAPTHPPIKQRREHLATFLRESSKREDFEEQADAALHLCDLLSGICTHLLDLLEPELIKAHKAGIRPAPKFRSNSLRPGAANPPKESTDD